VVKSDAFQMKRVPEAVTQTAAAPVR